MPNFIVISDQGGGANVWSEDDGATWTACTGITGRVARFRHGNGIWMAVAAAKIWASTDGKAWTDVTPGGASTFRDIEFGNGNWIAVGVTDFISSNNGSSWSAITRPVGAVWNNAESVVYGASSWVIGGNDSSATHDVLIRSTDDGATWATVSIPGAVMEDIWSLSYGGGSMVGWGDPDTAATGFSIYSTDDGATWTHPVSSNVDSFIQGRTAFGSSLSEFLFVARNRFGSPSNPQATSSDGSSWTRFAMSGVTSPFWRDVVYDGARWIVAGSGTVGGSPTPLVISSDLSTWTATTSPFAGVDANAVGALAAPTGGWSVGSIRIG